VPAVRRPAAGAVGALDRRYCTNACRQLAYEQRQRRARVQLLTDETTDESTARLDALRAAVQEAVKEEKLVEPPARAPTTVYR
jgi:hypothetical protein